MHNYYVWQEGAPIKFSQLEFCSSINFLQFSISFFVIADKPV